MWPRTMCSLSSLTRNIVLGRASTISPSISIFSSFPMRPGRVANRPPSSPWRAARRTGSAATLEALLDHDLLGRCLAGRGVVVVGELDLQRVLPHGNVLVRDRRHDR